ncbi:hypothetical protein LNQ52_07600 [Klebsiella pneumoniae subsp. pneumoniae]|nr:hypothetical protein [Klebsiella pneumoniae subsp. pneumoniae]
MEAGMRANIRVAVQYIEAWISGNGLRTDLWPDGRRRNGRDLAHLYLAVDPSSENPERRYPGH